MQRTVEFVNCATVTQTLAISRFSPQIGPVAMQSVNPPVKVVAGHSTVPGSALNQLYGAAGLQVDNQSFVYIADAFNNRIMRWTPNATVGTRFAGLTSVGASAQALDTPINVLLDEQSSSLYVVDSLNNRI